MSDLYIGQLTTILAGNHYRSNFGRYHKYQEYLAFYLSVNGSIIFSDNIRDDFEKEVVCLCDMKM